MSDLTAGEPKQLAIRKYPNRRYYDATRSRHVTLEEIHSLIRDGYEVSVTDSRTGADITPKVLAQIILELDPPKLDVFTAPLLHRLIRANEQLVQDFIDKYFNRALTAFLDSQRQFEAYLRHVLGLQSTSPPPPDWTTLMLGPFARQFWPQTPQAPAPGGNANAQGLSVEEENNLRTTVEELRAEVANLQKRLTRKKSKRD
jgi:polyhydroxyalkanoate synthesis repressor PhaR